MAIKKKLLIQLPKSNPYFPFSSNFKVLNFVRNDLEKDIIQYDKKLNKQGHMTIGKSSLHSKLTDNIESMKYETNWSFQESIQVGNMFWVFNGGKYRTRATITRS